MNASGDGPRVDRGVDLSVVIPAHNAASTITAQLDALLAQEPDARFEVLVVDDRSSDGTAQVVSSYAEHHPLVRLVNGQGGAGAGHARNVGGRAATGELLAFCDADDAVGEGWVAAMIAALREHEFVTGPLELERLNADWLIGARGRTTSGKQEVFDGIFPVASSCNLGLRRATFDATGGFDECRQIQTGEDLDLSYRLWRAGVALHFEPEAVVHYRYRPTMRANYQQARSYGRIRPLMAERLRRAGSPAPAHLSGLRNWAWLVRHLPQLSTKAGRARWLWVAGIRVGNLEGSLRVRRIYL